MYKKSVRRRRAVLAVLVGLSIALLTAYFGESASGGLHAIQRGFLEALAPLQEGASRALKPARDFGGWVGDVFDAKSENKKLREQVEELRARAGGARRPRSATPSSCARWSASTARPAFPTATTASRARDRALADGLVLDDHDRQGLGRRACTSNQPVVTGDGLVGQVSDVSADAAQVTLITDHTSGVSAQVVPDGANGLVKATVGNPSDLLLDFVAEGPRRCARARPSSRRAGARRGSSRCSRAASRSAGSRGSTASERELYQRVHLRPFADLRQLDIVEVLVPSAPAPVESAQVTP